jgi:hypothetical protein
MKQPSWWGSFLRDESLGLENVGPVRGVVRSLPNSSQLRLKFNGMLELRGSGGDFSGGLGSFGVSGKFLGLLKKISVEELVKNQHRPG